MKRHTVSYNIAAQGTILGYPAHLMLGNHKGEFILGGTLQWSGEKLSDSLEVVGDSMTEKFGSYVDDLLPQKLPGELVVYYEKNLLELGFQDSNLYFKLAKAGDSTALIFLFRTPDGEQSGQENSDLRRALQTAADFFGIQEFLFYAQTGGSWLLPRLAPVGSCGLQLPAEIKTCRFLAYSHISMEGDSVFVKAVHTLFGLRETGLYVGAGKQGFLCMIQIPSFKNDIMQGNDMYMLMEFGRQPVFVIKGSFVFSFIPDMRFTVDCGVRENAFTLEAFAHVEKPIPLFGIFSLGDTCLIIQVGAGLKFGMYTNLYIRNIQLFGAIILRLQGNVVVPELLSAAISDLSIPILVDNLLGEHINGINDLEFICIKGLPFQTLPSFDRETVKGRDVHGIVSHFNAGVKSDSLQLDETQVQVMPFGDGLDVTDLKRMRHYYIDKNGLLKLNAQFYYATTDTQLGNYTVTRGLFICGVIEIFKYSFEVLFSFREGEGVLAYAKVPSMDLGFLKIGPSTYSRNSGDTLPMAKDSVMAQFVNPRTDGMVFFLSARKRDISFYFDGMVDFLSLFTVDARIIFCKGLISLDLRTGWLGTFQVTLQIKEDYRSFSQGSFSFCLMIDTSKLTEKLTAVTRNIDNAISKLRSKIDSATREIGRAQSHVNELYREIERLDNKIRCCWQEISNTSGLFKKAAVFLRKGLEIGGYEVEKVGIYAAIGVATATLQAAKKMLEFTGKLGEGVMKAVNAVINGAMSLFYINYIRLKAEVSSRAQDFEAEIEFVALGKTYNLNKTIRRTVFEASPTGVLSCAINEKLQPDLNNIEAAASRSNWQRYRHENYTVEQLCRRLEQAKEQMDASIRLMTQMQSIYVDEFHTPMEEFDGMNVSMMDVLDSVENVLNAGARAGDVSQLADSMGDLKQSVAYQEKKGVFRDEELAEMKELIAQYDEAKLLYDKVVAGAGNIQKSRQKLERHQESLHRKTMSCCGEQVMQGTEADEAKVLAKVEETMYECFPVDRSGALFINPSREPVIQQCFVQAEKELGVEPSEKIQAMRSRSRKGSYVSRL